MHKNHYFEKSGPLAKKGPDLPIFEITGETKKPVSNRVKLEDKNNENKNIKKTFELNVTIQDGFRKIENIQNIKHKKGPFLLGLPPL